MRENSTRMLQSTAVYSTPVGPYVTAGTVPAGPKSEPSMNICWPPAVVALATPLPVTAGVPSPSAWTEGARYEMVSDDDELC